MGIFLSKTNERNNENSEKQIFSIVSCVSYAPNNENLEFLLEDFFRQNKILKTNKEISKWNSSETFSKCCGASKQIISFQVVEEKRPNVTKYVEKVNSFLLKNNVKNVKAWSIISIPKPFLPNIHCDNKQFGYLFPSLFFDYNSFLLLMHSISPYLDKNQKLRLDMSISSDSGSYFIVYLKGSKQLNHSIALTFFSLYSNIAMSKGKETLHDFTICIMDNKFEEMKSKISNLLPVEGLFFDFDDHPRFTMRARRPLLPPDKDVDFFSLKPSIEEWKHRVLFPEIEKTVIPILQK